MIEVPHEKIAVALAHGYAKATRQADGRDPARPGRPAAGHDGRLLQLHRPDARCSCSAAPVRPSTTGAGPTSTGSTRPTCRARRCGPTPSGTTSRARIASVHDGARPRLPDRDRGAARPGLRRARRRPAGGRRSRSPCRPRPTSPRLAAVPSPAGARARPRCGALAEKLCAATPSGDGARLRRPRPAVLPHAGRAGRDGRHRRDRDALAAELPEPAPAQRHRQRPSLDDADCVLFVDVKDMGKPTQKLDSATRTHHVSRLAPGRRVLDLGFNDIGISSWSEDYAELLPADLHGHRRHRGRPAAAAGGVPPADRRRGRRRPRRRARGVARPS